MRKICQCDQIACNTLVKIMRSNTASQHQIGFYSMADCFMRKHSGHHPVQNNRLFPGVGVDAFPLLHQPLIQRVNFRI